MSRYASILVIVECFALVLAIAWHIAELAGVGVEPALGGTFCVLVVALYIAVVVALVRTGIVPLKAGGPWTGVAALIACICESSIWTRLLGLGVAAYIALFLAFADSLLPIDTSDALGSLIAMFLASQGLLGSSAARRRSSKALPKEFQRAGAHSEPWHEALICNDEEAFKQMLKNGLNPNARVFGDQPLLLRAIIEARPRMAIMLLEAGADPRVAIGDGTTPLHAAASAMRSIAGTAAMFKVLRDGIGSLSPQMREFVEHGGAQPIPEGENACLVRELLARGAEVNARAGSSQCTPLHYAARDHLPEVVGLLLEARADVGLVDKDGRTPLHEAAAAWNLRDVAELLVTNGADVNARSNTWSTPLHEAAERGNVLVAKVLVEKGARPDAVDQNGLTPSELVRRNLADRRLDPSPYEELERLFAASIQR